MEKGKNITISNKLSLWLLALILLSLTDSCKITRKLVKKNNEIKAESNLVNNIKNSERNYKYLSYRFNGKFNFSEENYNLNGLVRIKKDSIIWVSVRLSLGIEFARIVITEDSVKLHSQLADLEINEKISFIKNFTGSNMNYDLFQSFFTNSIKSSYYDKINILSSEENNYQIDCNNVHFPEADFLIEKKYYKEKDNYYISAININDRQSGNEITIGFYDLVNFGNEFFPERMELILRNKNDIIKANIKISNVDFNKKL